MRGRKGTHVAAELFGCERKRLDDILFLKKVMDRAIRVSGLKKIRGGEKFHKFNPHGATGVVVLTSSHIAFHTWPEFGHMTIDIFACDSEEKVKKAFEYIVKSMKPKKVKKVMMKRGYVIK